MTVDLFDFGRCPAQYVGNDAHNIISIDFINFCLSFHFILLFLYLVIVVNVCADTIFYFLELVEDLSWGF